MGLWLCPWAWPLRAGATGGPGDRGHLSGSGWQLQVCPAGPAGDEPKDTGKGGVSSAQAGGSEWAPHSRGSEWAPPPSGGLEWTPDPRVLRVDPPCPGGSEWTPTLMCSVWAPPPCGLSGAPPPGSVWPRAWRSAAPWAAWCGARLLRVSQLVSGRVTVLVLTCGLFCVCTCVLAASAFSVSFGSDTRYSSFLFRARWPALSSFQSPLPLPVRPPVPPLSSPPPCGSAS